MPENEARPARKRQRVATSAPGPSHTKATTAAGSHRPRRGSTVAAPARARATADATPGRRDQRLRAAIDALSDQLYIVDAASMRFVDANRLAVRLSGYSQAEIGHIGPAELTNYSPEASRAFCDLVL
jgi:PAS domain-containing protein